MPGYAWLVLVWRLPTGVSTHRVTVWRRLRRLGAVPLTPGAAVLPYSEPLLEQLDWIADEVGDLGGDAWVLPVGRLSEVEEARIVERARADRAEEYRRLEADSVAISSGAAGRRRRKIAARDHFGSA